MADKTSIRYSLISTEDLDLDELTVRQVVIDIPLPQPVDPLTHQLIRDETGVREAVQQAKRRMNEIVASRLHEVRVNTARHRQGGKRKGEKIAKTRRNVASALEGDVRKALERLEPDITRAVSAAYRKHMKARSDYEASVTRWRVNVLFSSASFILKAISLSLGDIKSVVAVVETLWTTVTNLWELSKDEARVRGELTAMFEQIKTSASAPQQTGLWSYYSAITSTVSSLWYGTLTATSVRTKIAAYEEKLAQLDYGAKKLASELEGLLDRLEKSGDQGDSSGQVMTFIEQISRDAQLVADGRRFAARCIKDINDAERQNAFGSGIVAFMLPYAKQWAMFATVGYFTTGDRSFQFVVDELKKKAPKLTEEGVFDLAKKPVEDFVSEHLKNKKLARRWGLSFDANDILQICKIAVFPPDNSKETAALAADIAGQLLEKVGESDIKFDSPLFEAVIEGSKGLIGDLKDTLEDEDEEQEAPPG